MSFNFSGMYLNKLKIIIKKKAVIKNMFLSPIKVLSTDAVSNFGNFSYDNGVGTNNVKTTKSLHQAFNGASGNFEFSYYYGNDGNWYDPNDGKWKTSDYPISDNVSADTDGSGLSDFDIYIGSIKFTTSYHTELNPDYSSCSSIEDSSEKQKCIDNANEIAKKGVDIYPTFTININQWVSLYCSEAKGNGIKNNPKKTITTSVALTISSDSSKATVTLTSLDSAGDQFASGSFQVTGSSYELSIKKKLNKAGTISDFNKKKILFKLYE